MQNRKNTSPKNLMKFIKKMNQIEKKVAGLHYFEKLSVADIANILNENEKFVQRILEKFMAKISHQVSKTPPLSKGMSRQSK